MIFLGKNAWRTWGINFRSKLRFELHDITMSNEESVTTKVIKTLSNKKSILF